MSSFDILRQRSTTGSKAIEDVRELAVQDLFVSKAETEEAMKERLAAGGFGNAQGINQFTKLNADTNRAVRQTNAEFGAQQDAVMEKALYQLLGIEERNKDREIAESNADKQMWGSVLGSVLGMATGFGMNEWLGKGNN